MVTLTATSNPYLAPRLPLRGLLSVHEMRTSGYAQPRKMTFQTVDADGNLVGSRVAVDDAEFTYAQPRPGEERPLPTTASDR
ncbi:hypothetical protein V6N00_12440 [Tersicoccus sp. MR15.9]|uniref:hypothetical protein n=1 Tax=Tersicoccus mangrovi TaxID=3121635 RepID=UPI002FE5D951